MTAWSLISSLFLLLLATKWLGAHATVVVDDYATMLAAAVAAAASLLASRRAGGQARRAWLLLSASLLCGAGGGLAWTVNEVHLDRAPFPSLADVGYLSSVPLAVAALLTFPGGDRRIGLTRLRPVLDGAIAAGALLFVSWTIVLGPLFATEASSTLHLSIAVAYPASDVVIATIALLTVSRARGEQRTTMLLISGGFLLLAVADSAFTWFVAEGRYETGTLFDTGYLAGYLLIGVAALHYQPRPEGAATDIAVAPVRFAMLAPYAPLLFGLALAIGVQVGGKPLDSAQLSVTVFVVIAVLLRQLLNMKVIVALSHSLHASVATLREREAELDRTVAILRDREVELHSTVATLKEREVELHHQAFHDPLTGLANRALFGDRLDHALARSRRPGPVIVLLADLDDFKTVNDTYGHPAGDKLLVTVAERMRAVVRPEDTVARLGGDEFAILLETPEGLDGAREVAERINAAMQQPFYLAGVHTVVGASIGIVAADAIASSEAMLRDADIAMYAAKAQGKGGCVVYAAEFAVESLRLMRLKSDLNQAMSKGELSLKYMPIVDLDSGRMSGVEALLRWHHPSQGSVPRTTFIPLAEANGDILPIGRWVLAEACAQAGRWQKARSPGEPALQLAVNVSGRQLSDPQLIPAVRAALLAADMSPGLLTLEITESVLLDADATLEPLLALQSLGVHLAIDDFGTGHSALSRLRGYPIDTLKIDQSFVAAITPDASTPDVLITAILAVGHGLGMTVVAEGVETENQLAALREQGCRSAQGFLFARPADPEVIAELLRSGIALTDPATATAS